MPLITLILLPFLGSLLAAVLPANARNTESTLAGVIALACTVQAALYFPQIAQGEVLRQDIAWLHRGHDLLHAHSSARRS